MNKNRAAQSALLLGFLFTTACGGGSDSGGEATVNSMSPDPAVLSVGQGSIVSVKFSFSANDVIDHNDRVDLVLQFPAALQYRPGTAEIKRPIDDNQIDPAQLIACSDGSSFLRFSLGRGELTDATNPSGDADAELRLTVDTRAVGVQQVVGAASSNLLSFGCGQALAGQSSAVLNVNP